MWIVEPGSALRQSHSDDEDDEAGPITSDVDDDVEEEEDGEEEDDEDVEDGVESTGQPLSSASQRQRPPAARYFAAAATSAVNAILLPRKIHDVCFLCAGTDHHSGECPNEICMGCLKRGHRSRDCPTNSRACVCNRCGRIGHQRADCPELGRPSSGLSQCVSLLNTPDLRQFEGQGINVAPSPRFPNFPSPRGMLPAARMGAPAPSPLAGGSSMMAPPQQSSFWGACSRMG